jgi:hypothetical protein
LFAGAAGGESTNGVILHMDVSRFSLIWGRRWILTAAMLTLASVITVAALLIVPRTYQSDSSVIMLAPRSVARLTGGNPYLSFTPSLTLTASAVGDEVMAPGTARHLAARGFRAAYTVALAPYTTNTTGSVLQVTVTGSDKADVQATLHAVTAEISTQLAQLQGQVRRPSRILAATLSYSPQPTLSVSQTGRSLILLVVPVLLLALAVPVVVDALLQRRAGAGRATASHALSGRDR